MKKILIVVDMQNDFITGSLESSAAQKIVPAVADEIQAWVARGEEVVYTRDTHARDYLSTQEGKRLPVEHCVKDGHGWQIADGLYVGGKIFDKPTFGSLALGEYVKAGGYTEAELIGVCTDICVISNALLLKAYCPEMRVAVKAACCAGVTEESHQTALSAMQACQVDIV
jgi:nicotinamidase-related amidase